MFRATFAALLCTVLGCASPTGPGGRGGRGEPAQPARETPPAVVTPPSRAGAPAGTERGWPERWRLPASSATQGRAGGAGEPGWTALDPAARSSLRGELARTSVRRWKVEDEESLRRVAEGLQALSGLPIVVHPSAEAAALDAGVVFDFDFEHPILARDLLNLIARQAGEDVLWTVRHDVIWITTRERAGERYVLVLHDVRPQTFGRTDFSAPRIDRLRLLDDLEDDDGGGPFGGVGEVYRQIEEDDLAALVQEAIAPGTWEDDGVSIEAANGFLFVEHTREVQRRIARFLDSLAY